MVQVVDLTAVGTGEREHEYGNCGRHHNQRVLVMICEVEKDCGSLNDYGLVVLATD
jgi:hypothetical protein